MEKERNKSMKKIEIKYFSDEIEKLRYIDGKSDWIDLRASEDVVLKKGEFKLIPLGIAMKLPEGYEFLTQAKYDALSVCDRCHKKIISGERNINLTYLTGMDPWHRMVSLEKVCLCGDCAKELCEKYNIPIIYLRGKIVKEQLIKQINETSKTKEI